MIYGKPGTQGEQALFALAEPDAPDVKLGCCACRLAGEAAGGLGMGRCGTMIKPGPCFRCRQRSMNS